MIRKIKVGMRDGKAMTDFAAGYCEFQHLLNHKTPFAYSSGVYGWNCDYYELPGGFILATGYRTPKATWIDGELAQKYDRQARGKSREECERLLVAFVEELKALKKGERA